jgi:hypothetical protein
MNPAEIKIELFRKLDGLKDNKLNEVYGLLLNYINNEKDVSEWDSLSTEEKAALEQGIEQLNANKTTTHNQVLSAARKKHLND